MYWSKIWEKFLVLAIMVVTLLIPTAVMGAGDTESVGLVTSSEEPTVVLSVSTASLNFTRDGSDTAPVVIGIDSGVEDIIVTNTVSSNVPMTLTIEITGADASFYQDSLWLSINGADWFPATGWSYTNQLAIGDSLPIRAKIHTHTVITGAVASLTFIATPVVVP